MGLPHGRPADSKSEIVLTGMKDNEFIFDIARFD